MTGYRGTPAAKGDIGAGTQPHLAARNISAEMGPAAKREPMEPATCAACGGELLQHTGRGRPRRFCRSCVPPGTGAAATRAWRAADKVARGGGGEAIAAEVPTRYPAPASDPYPQT
jgi:hypothetical protein